MCGAVTSASAELSAAGADIGRENEGAAGATRIASVLQALDASRKAIAMFLKTIFYY